MILGLKVDVDTFRGTRDGVPRLLDTLSRHGVTASFFFSVGPDNMGRNLWRLFRPAFLAKMARSRAPSLYGWDILLRGTMWPGTQIGARLADVIRRTRDAGHEIGLHAWDHYTWQMHIEDMGLPRVREEIRRGFESLADILGTPPTCSAAPGWKCTEAVLAEKAQFPFAYNSDCRGASVFSPAPIGDIRPQPQVPTTLPTYDEIIGQGGVTDDSYNDCMLSRLVEGELNVLTVHAEVEGIARAKLFDRFLERVVCSGIRCVPLGNFVSEIAPPRGAWAPGRIAGREGTVSIQQESGTQSRQR